MLYKIKEILKVNDIPGFIKTRVQNVYGLYKRLCMVYGDVRLSQLMRLTPKELIALNLHDLLALKIMVEKIDECYLMLGYVHKEYRPVPGEFKDYICNPKPNMYQSLHTTVYAPDERFVQMQIRTDEMDKTASFGLTTYWDINKGDARLKMQSDLRRKYQIYDSLTEINGTFSDNEEFINRVKNEVFSGEIYVFTDDEDVIMLPGNATPIDFAYKVHTQIGNHMVGAIVNGKTVPHNYVLQNQDHVHIITDDLSRGPEDSWLEIAQSSLARRKIREYIRK